MTKTEYSSYQTVFVGSLHPLPSPFSICNTKICLVLPFLMYNQTIIECLILALVKGEAFSTLWRMTTLQKNATRMLNMRANTDTHLLPPTIYQWCSRWKLKGILLIDSGKPRILLDCLHLNKKKAVNNIYDSGLISPRPLCVISLTCPRPHPW